MNYIIQVNENYLKITWPSNAYPIIVEVVKDFEEATIFTKEVAESYINAIVHAREDIDKKYIYFSPILYKENFITKNCKWWMWDFILSNSTLKMVECIVHPKIIELLE